MKMESTYSTTKKFMLISVGLLGVFLLLVFKNIKTSTPKRPNTSYSSNTEEGSRTSAKDTAKRQSQDHINNPSVTTTATPSTRETRVTAGNDWFSIRVNRQQYTIDGGIYLPKRFAFQSKSLDNGIRLENNNYFVEYTFDIYRSNAPDINSIRSNCRKLDWRFFNYECNGEYYLVFNIPSTDLEFNTSDTVLVMKNKSNLSPNEIKSINQTLILTYNTTHSFSKFSDVVKHLHKVFNGITLPGYDFITLTTPCKTEMQLELINPDTELYLGTVFNSDYSSYNLYCPNMRVLIPTVNGPQHINANFILAIGWQGGDGVFPACNGYNECDTTTIKRKDYTVVLTGPTQNHEFSVTFPATLILKSTNQVLNHIELGFISKEEELIKSQDVW